jgi:pyruvate kinase
MSTARINLSHGDIKSNMKLINKFKMAKRLRPHKTCGLMLEARGREIRIGQVSDPSGELSIRSGTVITLNCHDQKGISD